MLEIMSYELSPFPTSLFSGNDVPRVADKAPLCDAISSFANSKSQDKAVTDTINSSDFFVLDGGSLLHRLPWLKGESFGAIGAMYADFVVKRFGTNNCTVVFDGYLAGPSIKDITHCRRGNHGATVSFTSVSIFSGRKEDFLSNTKNKHHFIELLAECLRLRGVKVICCEGDADVEIAKVSVVMSSEATTTLIGEDTDLLLLLLYYADVNSHPLSFRSDKAKKIRVFNILDIKRTMGPDLCACLLTLHAFTGCDSTSRIFSLGKKTAFGKMTKDNVLKDLTTRLGTPRLQVEVVEELGVKLMLALLGDGQAKDLASLRYTILSKKLMNAKSFVSPSCLPPTESATKFHARRVYFQIMSWTSSANDMSATDWGWKKVGLQPGPGKMLVPIMCTSEAAPEFLLKMISCSCTTGCASFRCSCKKFGLLCTAAC
jgi:hypothetical protein